MTAISLKNAQTRRKGFAEETYDQIFGPFDRGAFHELTEQEWQALMDGHRKSPHNPRSLALPRETDPGEPPSNP